MANRIKGITVEIGGDTTKLSKALEGVNKDIKGTQTQLKDVQKLLKLDPTNTELLSQKHWKTAAKTAVPLVFVFGMMRMVSAILNRLLLSRCASISNKYGKTVFWKITRTLLPM